LERKCSDFVLILARNFEIRRNVLARPAHGLSTVLGRRVAGDKFTQGRTSAVRTVV
jgi:hypothetical protein